MSTKYWLLKAEPDSRMVKGKDVKFSVDDFESVQISPWEGVRNYEARNLMREMQVGEKAVFYHSNCKNPGIVAFAEVAKEAYPDHTAWDALHPYYDPKSEKDKPKWHMVDLKFVARAKHFVPLTLLRRIADTTNDSPPEGIRYIGGDGVKAIRNMDLVTRGRLSVQRVTAEAWSIIHLLAENGGWEDIDLKPRKKSKSSSTTAKTSKQFTRARPQVVKVTEGKAKATEEGEDSPLTSVDSDDSQDKPTASRKSRTAPRKRKANIPLEDSSTSIGVHRRSSRRKVAN